jgi:hypothetical protein
MTNNPWENMSSSKRRRIDTTSGHNIFWMTDLNGNYGFYLQSNILFENTSIQLNIKGISTYKRNTENYGELFLVLNDNEEWQLFLVLCEDLISITHKYDNENAMINAVENRLSRWQKLLKYEKTEDMSVEKQMGLFTELICIQTILQEKIGLKNAINSWVGADFDKQDFLLDDLIIEVKSFKTSKSPLIKISSKYQLYSEKEPIYLLTYGLTQTDNGKTIKCLFNELKKMMHEDYEIIEIFEDKLIQYGFAPYNENQKLYSFIVDSSHLYYIRDNFPKLTPLDMRSEITKVNYTIDLTHCSDYLTTVEEIFTKKDF